MSNHINWDVCPEWVTFNKRTSLIQERPQEETLLFEEDEDKCRQPVGEGVTGKAIPLSHGSHYHKIRIKNGHEITTGPAIRTGRHQHFHFIQ